MFIGIGGEKIKGEEKIYNRLQFIGLYLKSGETFSNCKKNKGAGLFAVVEDKSIFKF
jgi:hypothetical protein